MARGTAHETEILRRRIWMYRSRGMSVKQISNAVEKSPSVIYHHLRKVRRSSYDDIEASGQPEIIGEMLLTLRELRQESLRNMTQVEQGSPMRAQWLDLSGRQLNNEIKFMMSVGLIKKVADRVELSVRDVRHMSDEEIRREIEVIKMELTDSLPKELLGLEMKTPETIDVEARSTPVVDLSVDADLPD